MTVLRRLLVLSGLAIAAFAVFAMSAASTGRASAGAVTFLPGGRIAGATSQGGDLVLFADMREQTVYPGNVGPVWTFLGRDVPWGALGDLAYVGPLPTYYTTDAKLRHLTFGHFRAASRETAVALRVPAWTALGLCVTVLVAGPTRRAFRTRRRRRRGLCLRCGYDVRGSSGICPECGNPLAVTPT